MSGLIVTFVLFGLSIACLSIGQLLGGRRFRGTRGPSACAGSPCRRGLARCDKARGDGA